MTCRNVHESLTQYASQLIANSLRCTFDSLPLLSDLIHARLPLNENENQHETPGDEPPAPIFASSTTSSHATSTKISACALDLVAECRNCSTIVCRNCTAKAPSDRFLKDRHRRLCKKCLRAPLLAHLQTLHETQDVCSIDTPPVSSASSTRSTRSVSDSSTRSDEVVEDALVASSFTSKAFLRGPCSCPTRGVWLCVACGHNLRASDTTYSRVWTWRSRYSTHMGGGIGTGLGLGDQGQKCGRGDQCLETGPESVSWVEIDCTESADEHDGYPLSRSATPVRDNSSPAASNNRPGYFSQEVDGIGGVRKRKVRKRVKVGATVYEYDDERKTGKYLDREASGRERSWCGWCGRLCLGEKDHQDQASYSTATATGR